MDRRVIVGVGLLAAAVIAAGVWVVSLPGWTEPDPESVPPDVPAVPAQPSSAESPAPRRARATTDAMPAADASDDAPPDDDGAMIRVSGVVMDDTDAKVPGATVTAWRMRRGVRTDDVETTADADGRFVLARVAKGSRLAARAGDLSPVQERCGVQDLEILLRLERRRLIVGRFVRADHPELPAVGVPVRSPSGTVLWSDPEGRWAFAERADTATDLDVAPQGAKGSESWAPLAVTVGAGVTEVQVEVMPLVTIRGRATAPDGGGVVTSCDWRPIRYGEHDDESPIREVVDGAVVRRLALRSITGFSSASGRFEIAGVRPGRGTLSISPVAGDEVATSLVLELRAGVGGDPAAPRRDVFVVRGERPSPELVPFDSSMPDDSGPDSLDVEALYAWNERRWRRLAEHRAARARADEEADRRAFAVGRICESLDVGLVRSDPITGRLVGPGGALAGKSVCAGVVGGEEVGRASRTDAEGRFTIRGVPGGLAVRLSVQGAGDEWDMAPMRLVVAGDREVEVRLVRVATELAGIVLDSAGNPAPGRTVSARRRDRITHSDSQATSGADGRFRIPAEPKTTYLLTVDGITAASSRASEDITLRLPALHRVAVRVRSADGRPITDPVWFEICEPEWELIAQVREGTLQIDSAPAGTYSATLLVGERVSGDELYIAGHRQHPAVNTLSCVHMVVCDITIPCDEIEFVVPAKVPR